MQTFANYICEKDIWFCYQVWQHEDNFTFVDNEISKITFNVTAKQIIHLTNLLRKYMLKIQMVLGTESFP